MQESSLKARRFTGLLQHAGHDAVFARDWTISADEEILAKAYAEVRVVITNDKDFGELIFRLGKPSEGVILLRLSATDSVSRFLLVKGVLEKSMGKFTVVEEGRIRVRKLAKE